MSAGNASFYLGLLARALINEGWRVHPHYDRDPALLRVLCPSLPMAGDSVLVKVREGGVPWFVGSTGDPLAPCHDLPGAVAKIGARLTPDAMAQAIERLACPGRRDEPPRFPTRCLQTRQTRLRRHDDD
ncbi:hypothetical protein [Actinomadura macra]|uniref:hypothetical protein n=1 Tax=Actinomadura macra TaxID=46164 RepID=UPI00082AACC9|nr:hypothetical protein [Actinomadura macra]